jgi:putative transport protein
VVLESNKWLKRSEDYRFGRGVFLSKLTRNGHELKPPPDMQLRNHDVLTLLGARKDVEEAAKFLGYADRATATSDIAFMSVAVVIGSLLGAVTIHLGGIPLSLSTSVGTLIAGLVCGCLLFVGLLAGKYIFKFHPIITLGACAGARTTTAALGALQEAASSPTPAIGYTIPYAVGRIALAISGVIIVLLMK